MSNLRKSQIPQCRHRKDRMFEVKRVQRARGKHHYLKCSVCDAEAANAGKPKHLIRWDADLALARREELRRRRAEDKTLRKRAA